MLYNVHVCIRTTSLYTCLSVFVCGVCVSVHAPHNFSIQTLLSVELPVPTSGSAAVVSVINTGIHVRHTYMYMYMYVCIVIIHVYIYTYCFYMHVNVYEVCMYVHVHVHVYTMYMHVHCRYSGALLLNLKRHTDTHVFMQKTSTCSCEGTCNSSFSLPPTSCHLNHLRHPSLHPSPHLPLSPLPPSPQCQPPVPASARLSASPDPGPHQGLGLLPHL